MFLQSIRLYHFRCYEELELSFDPKFNVVSGNNGQGKTSLLEAIYLLSTLKSFRFAKTSELIKFNYDQASIIGQIQDRDVITKLAVKITPHHKQGLVNGKNVKLLSEYATKLAAVSFSPVDLDLIRGAPELRRLWIDRFISIYNPLHLDLCQRYGKVLDHRNKALRELSEGKKKALEDEFEVWTLELINLGSQIIHNRIKTVDNLTVLLNRYYYEISKINDNITIEYKSEIYDGLNAGQGTKVSLESISQVFAQCLKNKFQKECIFGATLVGPHRDDLKVDLNYKLLKSYGSQGEIRSTVLAFRLAEVGAYQETRKIKPLLLVDDFSSELDAQRRQHLLEFISIFSCQVFLSTTEKLVIGKVFSFLEGKVIPNGNGYNPEEFRSWGL